MTPATQNRKSVSVLLLTVLVTLSILVTSVPAWGGKKVTIDGVLHVKNGDTPSQGRETLILEEAWRVGGDDEDGLFLAMVSEVCGDEAGNTYIMDVRLCQVHVLSPEGELLRTIFHQGEGPGETLQPRDLVITDDGVGLAEEFPSKIIMVDREGLPIDNVRPEAPGGGGGNLGALTAVDYGGGNLVFSGTQIAQGDKPGFQNRINFLSSYSKEGVELARYCQNTTIYNYNAFVLKEGEHVPVFWWGFDVGKDGKVYAAADREAYAISVFKPDGRLERVIERDYEPYKRNADEKQRIYDLYDSAVGNMPFEYKIVVEDTEPAIDYFHRGVRVADDGSIWVTSSRGLRDRTDGAMMTYDVFDADGHFTRQVAVMCDGNSNNDGLFWVSNDQVVLVTDAMGALAAQFGDGAALDSGDEEAQPQEVICYNVKRARQTAGATD